jgi:hypothetical protein
MQVCFPIGKGFALGSVFETPPLYGHLAAQHCTRLWIEALSFDALTGKPKPS